MNRATRIVAFALVASLFQNSVPSASLFAAPTPGSCPSLFAVEAIPGWPHWFHRTPFTNRGGFSDRTQVREMVSAHSPSLVAIASSQALEEAVSPAVWKALIDRRILQLKSPIIIAYGDPQNDSDFQILRPEDPTYNEASEDIENDPSITSIKYYYEDPSLTSYLGAPEGGYRTEREGKRVTVIIADPFVDRYILHPAVEDFHMARLRDSQRDPDTLHEEAHRATNVLKAARLELPVVIPPSSLDQLFTDHSDQQISVIQGNSGPKRKYTDLQHEAIPAAILRRMKLADEASWLKVVNTRDHAVTLIDIFKRDPAAIKTWRDLHHALLPKTGQGTKVVLEIVAANANYLPTKMPAKTKTPPPAPPPTTFSVWDDARPSLSYWSPPKHYFDRQKVEARRQHREEMKSQPPAPATRPNPKTTDIETKLRRATLAGERVFIRVNNQPAPLGLCELESIDGTGKMVLLPQVGQPVVRKFSLAIVHDLITIEPTTLARVATSDKRFPGRRSGNHRQQQRLEDDYARALAAKFEEVAAVSKGDAILVADAIARRVTAKKPVGGRGFILEMGEARVLAASQVPDDESSLMIVTRLLQERDRYAALARPDGTKLSDEAIESYLWTRFAPASEVAEFLAQGVSDDDIALKIDKRRYNRKHGSQDREPRLPPVVKPRSREGYGQNSTGFNSVEKVYRETLKAELESVQVEPTMADKISDLLVRVREGSMRWSESDFFQEGDIDNLVACRPLAPGHLQAIRDKIVQNLEAYHANPGRAGWTPVEIQHLFWGRLQPFSRADRLRKLGFKKSRVREILAGDPAPFQAIEKKVAEAESGQKVTVEASLAAEPGGGFVTTSVAVEDLVYANGLAKEFQKAKLSPGVSRKLAQACVRIRHQSLVNRSSLLSEDVVKAIQARKPLNTKQVVAALRTEYQLYRKAKIPAGQAETIVFERLHSYSSYRVLVQDGLTPVQAASILTRSDDSYRRWNTELKPFREAMCAFYEVDPFVINPLVIYGDSAFERWEAIQSAVRELQSLGMSFPQALRLVAHHKNASRRRELARRLAGSSQGSRWSGWVWHPTAGIGKVISESAHHGNIEIEFNGVAKRVPAEEVVPVLKVAEVRAELRNLHQDATEDVVRHEVPSGWVTSDVRDNAGNEFFWSWRLPLIAVAFKNRHHRRAAGLFLTHRTLGAGRSIAFDRSRYATIEKADSLVAFRTSDGTDHVTPLAEVQIHKGKQGRKKPTFLFGGVLTALAFFLWENTVGDAALWFRQAGTLAFVGSLLTWAKALWDQMPRQRDAHAPSIAEHWTTTSA